MERRNAEIELLNLVCLLADFYPWAQLLPISNHVASLWVNYLTRVEISLACYNHMNESYFGHPRREIQDLYDTTKLIHTMFIMNGVYLKHWWI